MREAVMTMYNRYTYYAIMAAAVALLSTAVWWRFDFVPIAVVLSLPRPMFNIMQSSYWNILVAIRDREVAAAAKYSLTTALAALLTHASEAAGCHVVVSRKMIAHALKREDWRDIMRRFAKTTFYMIAYEHVLWKIENFMTWAGRSRKFTGEQSAIKLDFGPERTKMQEIILRQHWELLADPGISRWILHSFREGTSTGVVKTAKAYKNQTQLHMARFFAVYTVFSILIRMQLSIGYVIVISVAASVAISRGL